MEQILKVFLKIYIQRNQTKRKKTLELCVAQSSSISCGSYSFLPVTCLSLALILSLSPSKIRKITLNLAWPETETLVLSLPLLHFGFTLCLHIDAAAFDPFKHLLLQSVQALLQHVPCSTSRTGPPTRGAAPWSKGSALWGDSKEGADSVTQPGCFSSSAVPGTPRSAR